MTAPAPDSRKPSATDPSRASRQAALAVETVRVVAEAVEQGQPADHALGQWYRRHPQCGSHDRHFLSMMTFAYFRWRGWVGAAVSPASLALAARLESAVSHPAVAALQAEQKTPADRAESMWGGLPLPERAVEFAGACGLSAPPSLEALVPEWVPSLLEQPVEDPAFLARCLASFQHPPPVWLRVLDGQRDRMLKELRSAGAEGVWHPVLPGALSLSRRFPSELAHRCAGAFEIQDLASQAVGWVARPEPESSWWDVCCGSGGKALHLAALMEGRGRVLATDVRPGILDSARRRLAAGRPLPITLRTWDGSADPVPEKAFDGVLLDAPCSGMGTWSRSPDARWRLRREEVLRLAALQARLLERCAQAVKPGGVLLYATCTLTRAENGEVVESFLSRHPEFTPGPFLHPLNNQRCPGSMRIWPWEGPCNGMFVARLVRLGA